MPDSTHYWLNLIFVCRRDFSLPQTAVNTAQTNTTTNSNWVAYKCHGGKQVTARYKMGEATASAEVKINGKTFNMQYDNESNADVTVFSGQGYRWSINNIGASNIHRADNGFPNSEKNCFSKW